MVKKFQTKSVVLGILTTILTVLGVLVGLFTEYRGILVTLLIVIAIIYICALYYYSENQKSLDDLEKRIAASENKRKFLSV